MAEATDSDDLILFLGDALPGFLDTWVTVVRRDTGRPLGVYTANENRTGAGTLPDDPLVYQLHHVDVVAVDDSAGAGVRDMEDPVFISGWAHYTGGSGHENNDGNDDAAAAAAACPPYEYLDLQGEPLCSNLDDWSRDAWFVDEDTEMLDFWEDDCDGFPSLF